MTSTSSSQILTSNIMAVIHHKAATPHKAATLHKGAVIHHRVVTHPQEDIHQREVIHQQEDTHLVVTHHNPALSCHLQRAVAMAPTMIPKVNQRISLSTIWAYAKDLFAKSTWYLWYVKRLLFQPNETTNDFFFFDKTGSIGCNFWFCSSICIPWTHQTICIQKSSYLLGSVGRIACNNDLHGLLRECTSSNSNELHFPRFVHTGRIVFNGSFRKSLCTQWSEYLIITFHCYIY